MKQTPRDLLFERHAIADTRLDALRRAAIADATPIPTRQLLHALFFPQRRLWIGLAAVWVALLGFQLTQRPKERSPNHSAETRYASNWSANQAQLHALLTETRSYH